MPNANACGTRHEQAGGRVEWSRELTRQEAGRLPALGAGLCQKDRFGQFPRRLGSLANSLTCALCSAAQLWPSSAICHVEVHRFRQLTDPECKAPEFPGLFISTLRWSICRRAFAVEDEAFLHQRNVVGGLLQLGEPRSPLSVIS